MNNRTRTLGNTDQGFSRNQTQLILRLEIVWFLVCHYLCFCAVSCSCSRWAECEHRSSVFHNASKGGRTQNCPLLWNFHSSLVDLQDLNNSDKYILRGQNKLSPNFTALYTPLWAALAFVSPSDFSFVCSNPSFWQFIRCLQYWFQNRY